MYCHAPHSFTNNVHLHEKMALQQCTDSMLVLKVTK